MNNTNANQVMHFCGPNITIAGQLSTPLIKVYGESCDCFIFYPRALWKPQVYDRDHPECSWKCSLTSCGRYFIEANFLQFHNQKIYGYAIMHYIIFENFVLFEKKTHFREFW